MLISIDVESSCRCEKQSANIFGYFFAPRKCDSSEQGDVCLLNAMQYITGTKSRPLKEEKIKAANDALKIAKLDNLGESVTISKDQRMQLEACVFCHKGILIGDKTLLDTVQPMKDWSLKAAKKLQSCACCAPEEDDNPGPEDDFSATTPGAFAPSRSRKSGYVDGKVSFAFDPTMFSKPGRT